MTGSFVDFSAEADLEALLERSLEGAPIDAAIQERHEFVEIGSRAVQGQQWLDAVRPGQPPRVRVGDAPPLGDELLESVELRETHRGVELAESPVVSETDGEVGEEALLALISVLQSLPVDRLVIRDDHAALARRDHLRRVERERGGGPEGPGHAAV